MKEKKKIVNNKRLMSAANDNQMDFNLLLLSFCFRGKEKVYLNQNTKE